MNESVQNIIILVIFVYAIWSLIQQLRGSIKDGGCSSSCGSCSTLKKDVTKINTRKIDL